MLFDVRPVDVDGEYLARAFFPSDQRADRNVLIDNSSFELRPGETLQLVGILRHELGHALGWRHEHTRPEAGTCFEDDQFKPLTAYDAFSVMHYPQCNGGGDWSLTLTGLDKAGAACIYGKGSNNTENLDQCTYHAPDAPATGTEQTKIFDNQTVAQGEKKHYGPFAVKPGSIAAGEDDTASAAAAGDPDLYVRYLGKPDTSRWNCRPYLSHAKETCELEVPGQPQQDLRDGARLRGGQLQAGGQVHQAVSCCAEVVTTGRRSALGCRPPANAGGGCGGGGVRRPCICARRARTPLHQPSPHSRWGGSGRPFKGCRSRLHRGYWSGAETSANWYGASRNTWPIAACPPKQIGTGRRISHRLRRQVGDEAQAFAAARTFDHQQPGRAVDDRLRTPASAGCCRRKASSWR